MKNAAGFTAPMALLVLVAGSAAATEGVSPGTVDRVAVVDTRCPTFSWQEAAGAALYELLAYRLPAEDGAGVELCPEDEVLYARVPGGASSWTPSSEQCFDPGGRFVWFVRGVMQLAGDEVIEAGEWSAPRYFEVPAGPTPEELARALDVLKRWQAANGSPPLSAAADSGAVIDSGSRTGTGSGSSRRKGERGGEREGEANLKAGGGPRSMETASAAIRGANPETALEAYGVVGISGSVDGAGVGAANTEGGPDLLLDGSIDGTADTTLSEWGIDRSSATDQVFSVRNMGGGAMTLDVLGTLRGTALDCPGCVGTAELADEAVTSDAIEDGGITEVDLGVGSVNSIHIVDGSVQAQDLAPDAISGSGIADGTIDTADLADGAVTSIKLGASSVTTAKLDDASVTTDKIAAGAVGAVQIAFESVGESEIADEAITNPKIAPGAVDSSLLADGAVTANKLASASVGSQAIRTNAVTSTHIADEAVGTTEIEDGGVTSADIDPGAVTSGHLGPGAVTTEKLADGAVTGPKLASGSVTSGTIRNNAVTNAHLADDAVTGTEIADGTVTGSDIAAASISTSHLNDGSVTTAKLAVGSVTSASLADFSITGTDIGVNAVDSIHIADNAVSVSEILSGSVITSKLADDAVTTAKVLDGTLTAADIDPTGGLYTSVTSIYSESRNSLISPGETQEVSASCLDLNDLPFSGGCQRTVGEGQLTLVAAHGRNWVDPVEIGEYVCLYRNDGATVSIAAASVYCIAVP